MNLDERIEQVPPTYKNPLGIAPKDYVEQSDTKKARLASLEGGEKATANYAYQQPNPYFPPVCPHCSRCPHCGRGPVNPYNPPQPIWVYNHALGNNNAYGA